jgi:hypothetical protein
VIITFAAVMALFVPKAFGVEHTNAVALGQLFFIIVATFLVMLLFVK